MKSLGGFAPSTIPQEEERAITMCQVSLSEEVLCLYQLQDALCVLASSGQVQADYIRRHGFGDCLDELALEFSAWYEDGKSWEYHRLLTLDQLQALKRVDAQLSSMSGPSNEFLWQSDGLASQEWNVVRQLSSDALAKFDFVFDAELRTQLSRRWPDSWATKW